tara:strand:+ start:1034 stop:1351 length:318 start_codon:yes stop_codon:yes gene_type:complete
MSVKFTFHNPSASAYFIMETTKSFDEGYTSATPKYASGSFSSFTGSDITTQQTFLFKDGIVQDDFKLAQVVPPGTSSFTFNNTITIPVGTVIFRGTGDFDLIIET